MSGLFETVALPSKSILSPLVGFFADPAVDSPKLGVRIAIFLVIVVLLGWGGVVAWEAATEGAFDAAMIYEPMSKPIIGGLCLILLPVLGAKLLGGSSSPAVSGLAELDETWNKCLKALKDEQIDLKKTPIYLVTGVDDDLQASALLGASEQQFAVNQTPRGPAPLHVFATRKAILISLTDITCVGKFTHLLKSANSAPSGPPGFGAPGQDPFATAGIGGPMQQTAPDPENPFATGGFGAPPGMDDDVAAGGATIGLPFGVSVEETLGSRGGAGMTAPSAPAKPRIMNLPPKQMAEQIDQLEYFCHLLSKATDGQPCVDGILQFLSYDLLNNQHLTSGVRSAIRSDVDTLVTHLGLRCPTIVLVGGMEADSGFQELVRRIGTDAARQNRFGKGFEIEFRPTDTQIAAVCAHATNAFEEWVYHLFRQRGSVTEHGNPKLYALLCEVRGELRNRLTDIMVHALGISQRDTSGRELPLFGGCYFAATGKQPHEQRAFVRSVFEKLMSYERSSAWTSEARKEQEAVTASSSAVWAVNTLLLLSLLVGIGVAVTTTKPAQNTTEDATTETEREFQQVVDLGR